MLICRRLHSRHYWQLFANQQTDLLLLPPLTGAWQGFHEWWNHWCILLNPNKTKGYVNNRSGLWTLPMVTWSCLGFISAIVPTRTSFVWRVTASSPSKTMCGYCCSCVSENWYFEVGETDICGHLCVTSLLFCIGSQNPWVLFSCVGVSCWMSLSASRAQGVFGDQALSSSEFFVVVSSTEYCWA